MNSSHSKLIGQKTQKKKSTTKSSIKTTFQYPKQSAEVSSNWKSLLETLPKKRKRSTTDNKRLDEKVMIENALQAISTTANKKQLLSLPQSNDLSITKYLLVHFETIVVQSIRLLRQICILNSFGNVIYQKSDLDENEVRKYSFNAKSYKQLQKEVVPIFKNHILVGFNLETLLKALLLKHPKNMIRDLATYSPIQILEQKNDVEDSDDFEEDADFEEEFGGEFEEEDIVEKEDGEQNSELKKSRPKRPHRIDKFDVKKKETIRSLLHFHKILNGKNFDVLPLEQEAKLLLQLFQKEKNRWELSLKNPSKKRKIH